MKASRGSTVVVAVLAVILLLGIVGYFVFSDTPIISDPYEGWETYRNEELGYNVRYPAGYHMHEPKIGEDIIVFGKNSTFLHEVTFRDEWPMKDFSVSIITHDNPNNLTAQEWADERNVGSMAKSLGVYKTVTVSGLDGVWAEVAGNGTSIIIVLGGDDRIIGLRGHLMHKEDPSTLNTFTKLLNSLQID